jgi:hypothetical protein
MRNRRGLNKIWILALALLIALGAMGVTYSAWVDEIYIEGTFDTSGINTTLDCGTCSLTGTPPDPNTSITCDTTGEPLEVTISVSNAQTATDYYCSFTINNPADSLPVKIDGVTLALLNPLSPYADVSAAITVLPAPTALDPGDTTTTAGEVHISLTSSASETFDLEYTLTATVLRWNQ